MEKKKNEGEGSPAEVDIPGIEPAQGILNSGSPALFMYVSAVCRINAKTPASFGGRRRFGFRLYNFISGC